MKVLTTNHTRVNYYAIDFGWGIPVHVNPIEAIDTLTHSVESRTITLDGLDRTKSGLLQVDIDKNNLNLPEYKETYCDVHFDKLKTAGFDSTALPDHAETAGPIMLENANGVIKLVNIHVHRLKDNSGVAIFASIAHAVVDGAGFSTFMKRWSTICKLMASDGLLASIPKQSISNNRGDIGDCLPKARTLPGSRLETLRVQGGVLSRWIARMSPQLRGKLFSALGRLFASADSHYFISRQMLNQFRSTIDEFIPEKQQISDNDIIMTLLSIVTARSLGTPQAQCPTGKRIARARSAVGRMLGKPPKLFGTIIAVSMRPRCQQLADSGYCGNAVVPLAVSSLLSELQTPVTPNLLAKVAVKIRNEVDAVDADYIGQVVDLVNQVPDYYLRPMLYNTQYTKTAFATNLSSMGWYEIDFGGGAPEWVSFKEGSFASAAVILPAPPSLDGYMVHMMVPKKLDKYFRKSRLWTSNAELVR
ncbi:hypothetical protein IWW51_002509 [Coemansia sp. RSA 2702]|nr:hypothetical protein IWW51_002509 [Coemansia sp. RSA 2702]